MNRRAFVVGMGTAAVGGSTLLASGAFSRVESQRNVTIEVVGDDDAYLRLVYADRSVDCEGTVVLVELTNQLKETIQNVTIQNVTVDHGDVVVHEPPMVPSRLDVGESGEVWIEVECDPGTDATSTVSFDVVVEGTEHTVTAHGRTIEVECECAQTFEGCTPGFWRSPRVVGRILTDGDRYGPSDTLGDVFGGANWVEELDEMTLVDALRLGGGPGITGAQYRLARNGTAALLNAMHHSIVYLIPDDSGDEARARDVIEAVEDVLEPAIDHQDRTAILALAEEFDENNNAGCPLDAGGE